MCESFGVLELLFQAFSILAKFSTGPAFSNKTSLNIILLLCSLNCYEE